MIAVVGMKINTVCNVHRLCMQALGWLWTSTPCWLSYVDTFPPGKWAATVTSLVEKELHEKLLEKPPEFQRRLKRSCAYFQANCYAIELPPSCPCGSQNFLLRWQLNVGAKLACSPCWKSGTRPSCVVPKWAYFNFWSKFFWRKMTLRHQWISVDPRGFPRDF